MQRQDMQELGRRTRARTVLGLLFWLLLTFLVAAFGAQFQPGEWYRSLAKPEWTPPGWIFAPVWTFLYASMAVAAWLVWRDYRGRAAGISLSFYVLQLLLNGLWSWSFFGRQSIGSALVDILGLLLLVGATTLLFWRINRPAGILFIPYVLWVGFATALNFKIWLIN
jgi:tryptophan-rich sensory protein